MEDDELENDNMWLEDNLFVIHFKQHPADIRLVDRNGSVNIKKHLAHSYAVESRAPKHLSDKERYNYIVDSVLDGCSRRQLANIDSISTNGLDKDI